MAISLELNIQENVFYPFLENCLPDIIISSKVFINVTLLNH